MVSDYSKADIRKSACLIPVYPRVGITRFGREKSVSYLHEMSIFPLCSDIIVRNFCYPPIKSRSTSEISSFSTFSESAEV